MSELFTDPKPDRFEHESPLRAFTEFNKQDWYAIGKGFRPSLQHLPVYLDAIRRKEKWRLVQVLEATTGTPSFVFERDAPALQAVPSHTYRIEGYDSEKVHWRNAQWRGDMQALRKRMLDIPGRDYQDFLTAHNVDSASQFWQTASVAAVLRLIDKLNWWYKVSLNAIISVEEMTKALGHEPSEAALRTIRIPLLHPDEFLEPSPEKKAVWDEVAFKTDLAEEASRAMDSPYSEFARAYMYLGADAERKIGVSPALGAPYSPIMPEIKHTPAAQEAKAMLDDPISPAHYDGTECMEIVDNLPGNLAHAFTYLWRAGRKPGVPAKEDLAKARRFLEREVHLQGFPNHEMAEDADEGDDVSPYDYTLPGQTRFYYMRARLASKRASENPFIPFATQRIAAKLGESQNARLCRAVVGVVGLADFKIRRDVRAIIREVDAWIECIESGGDGGCTGYGRQLEP